MNLQTYIGVILLFMSVIMSLVLIMHFFHKGKRTATLYSFVCFQSLVFIWSLGQVFEIFSYSRQAKWNATIFEYFGIEFIGLSWMIFSFLYTTNKKILNKKYIIPLFIPSIILYISVLTNDYHNLFYSSFSYNYSSYGILFWIHLIVSYAYLSVGTALMIKYSIEELSYKRKQSILITIAVLIPIISNAIYISRHLRFNIDITPVSFSISMLLFSVATFKYRFLDIVPIATKKAVDNMAEAIVIVDNFNKIVDFNNSFISIFLSEKTIKNNENIKKFISNIKQSLKKQDSSTEILNAIEYGDSEFKSGEIVLVDKKTRCFKVNVQPIYDYKKGILGRVISFNDISMYKNLVKELDEKNSQLLSVNEQLKEYSKTVEELAIAKERNRITQDVHDTLGHTMTLLITLLEVCKITYSTDTVKTEEKLCEATDIARSGLRELRNSIAGLVPYKLEEKDLVSDLRDLTSSFQLAGMKTDLIVEGINDQLKSACRNAIYRICKEALTNSLRHGKAKQVSIILRNRDSKIKLFIFDDGCGCGDINKGLGLTGIENRVKDLNGSITYGSDGEKGFNIHIEIQLEGEAINDKNDNSR